jgi:hypothetical protein
VPVNAAALAGAKRIFAWQGSICSGKMPDRKFNLTVEKLSPFFNDWCETEWISSEWPVCAVSETATPHRMGAALTYARRYALFALAGIAGEDDLDAPDLIIGPSPATAVPSVSNGNGVVRRKSLNGTIHKASAALRDLMIVEIKALTDGDGLALWAHKRLPAKNSLTAEDAAVVEAAYQGLLTSAEPLPELSTGAPPLESSAEPAGSAGSEPGKVASTAHVGTLMLMQERASDEA